MGALTPRAPSIVLGLLAAPLLGGCLPQGERADPSLEALPPPVREDPLEPDVPRYELRAPFPRPLKEGDRLRVKARVVSRSRGPGGEDRLDLRLEWIDTLERVHRTRVVRARQFTRQEGTPRVAGAEGLVIRLDNGPAGGTFRLTEKRALDPALGDLLKAEVTGPGLLEVFASFPLFRVKVGDSWSLPVEIAGRFRAALRTHGFRLAAARPPRLTLRSVEKGSATVSLEWTLDVRGYHDLSLTDTFLIWRAKWQFGLDGPAVLRTRQGMVLTHPHLAIESHQEREVWLLGPG